MNLDTSRKRKPDMGQPTAIDAPSLNQRKPKPWGYERPVGEFRGLFLKELFLQTGKMSSLHFHKDKDELLYIIEGQISVILDGKEFQLVTGDTIHIRPGQQHRLRPHKDTLILEIGTRMFGDIVRIADEYNRPNRE